MAVHTRVSVALLAAVVELLGADRMLAQTAEYTLTEVSTATGQVACRINNLGDLVGRASNSVGGGTGAATWSHGTLRATRLGFFSGGDYSSGFAINDAGQVAGASNTSNAIVPFVWKATGGLQRIPLLRGDNCGQAFSINRSGHVAGYSSGPNGARAFVWTGTKAVRSLGSLPGENYSRARAINDSDEVAGTSSGPDGQHAVLWTATGIVRDLGTLPGDTSSEATAINNAGEVVGYSKGSGRLRAFLWTTTTGMQDLGVLLGGSSSRALDINDSGAVVGSSGSSSGDHAFIWTKREGMVDLNSAASAGLGVVFVEAHSINNIGAILIMGKVTHSSGGTALPEHQTCAPAPPSTFLLTPASE
jgi:probable HAF family extracellular repeat protein